MQGSTSTKAAGAGSTRYDRVGRSAINLTSESSSFRNHWGFSKEFFLSPDHTFVFEETVLQNPTAVCHSSFVRLIDGRSACSRPGYSTPTAHSMGQAALKQVAMTKMELHHPSGGHGAGLIATKLPQSLLYRTGKLRLCRPRRNPSNKFVAPNPPPMPNEANDVPARCVPAHPGLPTPHYMSSSRSRDGSDDRWHRSPLPVLPPTLPRANAGGGGSTVPLELSLV